MKIIEFLLNLIFPTDDKSAGVNFDKLSLREIQLRCKKSNPTHIGLCVFSYKDPLIRELIWQMKFKNNKKCALLCGDILRIEIKKYLRTISPKNMSVENFLLIPIPIHKKRRYERGFNQCERICENIMRSIKDELENIIYEPQILKRTIYREKQSWSDRKDRAEKIRGVFEINRKKLYTDNKTIYHLKNSTVLLIDDVATTGATVTEAKKVLISAGFRDVVVFTVAH